MTWQQFKAMCIQSFIVGTIMCIPLTLLMAAYAMVGIGNPRLREEESKTATLTQDLSTLMIQVGEEHQYWAAAHDSIGRLKNQLANCQLRRVE